MPYIGLFFDNMSTKLNVDVFGAFHLKPDLIRGRWLPDISIKLCPDSRL